MHAPVRRAGWGVSVLLAKASPECTARTGSLGHTRSFTRLQGQVYDADGG